VSVVGFVHIPGSYPYYPNFTVNDYISLAGGISREGSLKSIKILRSDGSSDSDLNSHLNPGDVIEVKRSFSDFLVGDINVLSVITTTASLILTWIAATK
jgi:protein involved in polysaccharide export with SLBB domain